MKHFLPSLLLIMLLFASCKPAEKKESRIVFLLGTVCGIQLFTDKSQKDAHTVLTAAFNRIEQLERHLSANAAESTLITVNTSAGSTAVSIPADIVPIFKRAVFFAEQTNGAFNPAIGSIVKLWNIGFENERVPADAAIKHELDYTDYREIAVTDGTVFLKKAGMKLDLGAIAKGFAADQAALIIQQNGIRNALIDIGGTITAIGGRPQGKPWIIGIRDPRQRHGEPILSTVLSGRSISTSGSYERYFEQDGVRYHHIIDPKTGYPVRNKLVSVSIFSDSAADADALSTACFVLGYENALQLLSRMPNTDAVFIFDDNTIRTTAGFESSVHIINEDFRFAAQSTTPAQSIGVLDPPHE